MGYWNVRILRKTYPNGEVALFPAEVYYGDSGTILGWCPFSAEGDDMEDIRFYAKCLTEATEKPVLSAASFRMSPKDFNRACIGDAYKDHHEKQRTDEEEDQAQPDHP